MAIRYTSYVISHKFWIQTKRHFFIYPSVLLMHLKRETLHLQNESERYTSDFRCEMPQRCERNTYNTNVLFMGGVIQRVADVFFFRYIDRKFFPRKSFCDKLAIIKSIVLETLTGY